MKKILIVDDNMDFLRILSSALQKRFQTYESMGVADALKILESVTVDAVCSDFNMRDGTGLLLSALLFYFLQHGGCTSNPSR